jgi:hypothetical protein
MVQMPQQCKVKIDGHVGFRDIFPVTYYFLRHFSDMR